MYSTDIVVLPGNCPLYIIVWGVIIIHAHNNLMLAVACNHGVYVVYSKVFQETHGQETQTDSGRKPWTIVRRFDHIPFRTHNSSLDGAIII